MTHKTKSGCTDCVSQLDSGPKSNGQQNWYYPNDSVNELAELLHWLHRSCITCIELVIIVRFSENKQCFKLKTLSQSPADSWKTVKPLCVCVCHTPFLEYAQNMWCHKENELIILNISIISSNLYVQEKNTNGKPETNSYCILHNCLNPRKDEYNITWTTTRNNMQNSWACFSLYLHPIHPFAFILAYYVCYAIPP